MTSNHFIFFASRAAVARLLLGMVVWLPIAAQAQYGFTTNTNSTVTINSYSGPGGAVTIPDTIAGLPAVAIAPNAFFGISGLTSITMGTNLAIIGQNAFFQCPNLASVSFTGSVTNVGSGPFLDCESLTTITMTGANAFIGVSNNVIYNKSQTSLIQFPCGVTGTYTIPASVTNVSQSFIGNALTSIAVNAANTVYSSSNGILFDKSQTFLLDYPGAAAGGYTVPTNVTTILSAAFEYCKGITNVTIGTNVTNIGYVAFFFCPNLASISVNAANAFYSTTNGILFNKNKTQLIQYPLTTAGGYTVPGTVTNIADGAFGHAAGLTSVVIPNSVTSVGLESFYVCTNLASVNLGHGVTNIGSQAFFFCPALKSIVIPASVQSLSSYAFGDCQNLTNACFEGNAPANGGSVFYFDTALTSILHVNGGTGWGSSYDGIPTTPCTTCGGTAPLLTIVRSGTNVVVAWTNTATGYTLEATTNFSGTTNWTNLSGQFSVTNAIIGARKFYRLIQ